MSRPVSHAPALNRTGEAALTLASRGGTAVALTEFAVLLLRGSAAAILLSPLVGIALLLTG